jgi:TRAP-type uncharacterized transport system fused permease subunit
MSPITKVFLPSLLLIVALAVVAANYFGPAYAALTSNFANLFVTAPLVSISILLLVRDRGRGDLGKAWLCFAVVVILWFTAERIWMVYDLVYESDPWPSEADYFWLAGYPIYFAFTFFI